MIGPQLQLWDEQQVCAVCALEKSLGGRNGTAQTGPEFSTSLHFQLGQKLRVSSAAGSAGESQGRGSAPSDAESRRVTDLIHGLRTEFRWEHWCREVVTRLTSFIAFAGMFSTLLDGTFFQPSFIFSTWLAVSNCAASVLLFPPLMQQRKTIQSNLYELVWYCELLQDSVSYMCSNSFINKLPLLTFNQFFL